MGVAVVMVVAWPWVLVVEVFGFCFLYGFLGFVFSMGFWVLLTYGFLGFDDHEFVVGVFGVAVVKMTLVFN